MKRVIDRILNKSVGLQLLKTPSSLEASDWQLRLLKLYRDKASQ